MQRPRTRGRLPILALALIVSVIVCYLFVRFLGYLFLNTPSDIQDEFQKPTGLLRGKLGVSDGGSFVVHRARAPDDVIGPNPRLSRTVHCYPQIASLYAGLLNDIDPLQQFGSLEAQHLAEIYAFQEFCGNGGSSTAAQTVSAEGAALFYVRQIVPRLSFSISCFPFDGT